MFKMIIKNSVWIVISALLIGCGGSSSSIKNSEEEKLSWYKPSKDTTWQWQLTGDIDTSYEVDLYDIDLFDSTEDTIDAIHAKGKRVICYFSAGSYEEWKDDASSFSDSILGKELDGWEGERWLDIRRLDILAPIMEARLDLAKAKGCDGVEPDNVDGYINDTGFELSKDDQLKYNKFIAMQAHKRGLGVGLKNDLNQIDKLESEFDFAVNEECHYYNECDKLKSFLKHNKPVFNAEYDSKYIVDGEASIELCKNATALGLKTLVLPINLDDSFRYSCDSKDRVLNEFKKGFGGGASFKFQDENGGAIWLSAVDLMLDDDIVDNSYYQNIKNFDADKFQELHNYISHARYFTMWLTEGWEESWVDVDAINRAIKIGKTPVFVYWYFGDKLANGMPSDDEVDAYHQDNHKLRELLDKVEGEKILIIEPEFNKDVVLDNPSKFVTIISDAIDILKNSDTLVSLCMTDTGNRGVNQTYEKCGYDNCALGDKYEWSRAKDIYDGLIDKLDFISFQEMIGQFSRDPANPGNWDKPNPKAYSDDEIGIDYLPKRLENMSSYLY